MNENETPEIIHTDEDAVNGQIKCPKCGATEISLNVKTGKLRCTFCRYEFEPEKTEEKLNPKDIETMEGETRGSGTADIKEDAEDFITLKCTSCGAEVVVNTKESTQARCHWCRNMLSVNQKVPNGAVPDVVLPFKVRKKEAEDLIDSFAGSRKFFAHPEFKKEFSSDNIMGVYFPYMIIDANTHVSLEGEGEEEIRQYTEKISEDNEEIFYDADVYKIEREFDMTVEGLTVESSRDKLDVDSYDKTTNIINSIMPFDTENCVKWNSNYLNGYSSEKRDVNVSQLKNLVHEEIKDIARFAANETLDRYDRGVRWDRENLEVKGENWKAAYLPVWLYSYQKAAGEKLHYVAVNGRTKETMGSIPIHIPKLLAVSAVIEIIAAVLMIYFKNNVTDSQWTYIFLITGFVYFFIIYSRYRNADARHSYEYETKRQIKNMQKKDQLIRRLKHITRDEIPGANNERITR